MSEVYLALLHVPGEFVYGGVRADDVAAAVAAFAGEVELLGMEWLQTHDSLPPRGQEDEAVREVLARLEDTDVALVEGYPDDDEPDPGEALKRHVELWVDEAVARFGDFSLGDYAFVAQLRLEDGVELGWAYGGSAMGAAELFARAAEQARGGVDRGDG